MTEVFWPGSKNVVANFNSSHLRWPLVYHVVLVNRALVVKFNEQPIHAELPSQNQHPAKLSVHESCESGDTDF